MRIAILGGGFTGLTCALRLSKQGFDVSLFEREDYLGGLASGFKQPLWDWSLEKHYHHLFTSDTAAIKLLKEVGMGDDLYFQKPKTAVYYNKKFQIGRFAALLRSTNFKFQISKTIYPFDSPVDLLTFPHLSLLDKVRTGLILAYLKVTPFWKSLEKVTAYEWLKRYMGEKAFKVLWEPLFVGKFGDFAPTISMAWFWARIKKRSQRLGYIKGGFQSFAEKIGQEIKRNQGKIHLSTTVQEITKEGDHFVCTNYSNDRTEKMKFDKVVVTLPTSVFLKVVPSLPYSYRQRLSSISHLHSLNLIIILKKPFFETVYWLNINDTNFPFLAIVDHTNFIEPSHYGGNHIVYVGNYLPKDHHFFTKSKEEILNIFHPFLSKLNPIYRDSLLDFHLFRGPDAQTIIPINYSKIRPSFSTPWDNLYLSNLDMVYPWDRGTNYAIELGEKVATLVIASTAKQS